MKSPFEHISQVHSQFSTTVITVVRIRDGSMPDFNKWYNIQIFILKNTALSAKLIQFLDI